jgi:hypothetical protein
MSEWKNVKRGCPKVAGKYLVFMPRLTDEGRFATTYYENKSWGVGEKVTHWMELPEQPISKTTEAEKTK